jgi:RNA-directed DNA polymerase
VSCFDTIPHDKLMKVLEARVSDRSVLRLIRMWLRVPVQETKGSDAGKLRRSSAGTPQGGVISPLLANAYLHWLDKLFMEPSGPGQWARARIVRYADDFQIFAHRMTPRLTAWVTGLLEGRMGLTINVSKTSTVRVVPGGAAVDFLGYRFRWERSPRYAGRPWLAVKPSPKSQQRFRDRVGEMTARCRNAVPVGALCAKLNRFLSGWAQYFGAFHRQCH